MQVDIGAFDLAVRVGCQVEWLEPSDDIAVLNLRGQFEANLDLIAKQYQTMFSKAMAAAVVKHKMYFEVPDLNLKGLNDDELESLKDLG